MKYRKFKSPLSEKRFFESGYAYGRLDESAFICDMFMKIDKENHRPAVKYFLFKAWLLENKSKKYQEVIDFPERARKIGKEQRAVTEAQLLIPTVVLDLIRENIKETFNGKKEQKWL